jgi:hypothetical protein
VHKFGSSFPSLIEAGTFLVQKRNILPNGGVQESKPTAMGKTATTYRISTRTQNTKQALLKSLMKYAMIIGGLCLLWIYVNA